MATAAAVDQVGRPVLVLAVAVAQGSLGLAVMLQALLAARQAQTVGLLA
jgi:hypothetical protein